MLNPSPTVIIVIAAVALVAVFVGLSTDAGFFSWVAGALLALYLAVVGIARLVRGPAAGARSS